MNAQEKLYDLLINEDSITQYVSDRIYPLKFNKEGTFPVIVYELVDIDYHNTLTNDDMVTGEAYIVLNIISKSYNEIQVLTNEIINLLKVNAYTFSNTHEYYEDTIDLYGRQLTVQNVNLLA